MVGTVEQMAQCWPYTFNQKLAEDDKRTLLDTKGAPTLYLKWCKAGAKFIFASAFRNGSDKIATAISTMHTQHHWEGIVQNEKELRMYKQNKKSLIPLFFTECPLTDGKEQHPETVAESEAMEWLLESTIKPITLRQSKLFSYLCLFLFLCLLFI